MHGAEYHRQRFGRGHGHGYGQGGRPPPPYGSHYEDGEEPGARHVSRQGARKSVDYGSSAARYVQVRLHDKAGGGGEMLQPTPGAAIKMLLPIAYKGNPSTSYTTRFVHASTNKLRCSINCAVWTPDGRRLITGLQSGEFTLWNGLTFNFEMILQAHDVAVRSMQWSHNDNYLISGDDVGNIKIWQPNMNNINLIRNGHKEAVRGLSFSPTDLKFCSCSDDTSVKVWDFARSVEERVLKGHGWDVKCCAWHPRKGLIASGAKDSLVKLWDAQGGREIATLHGHKSTVMSVQWNGNGNWLLSASRDQLIKLFDVRMLKEMQSFHGHDKEVTALAWHPVHEELFVSGAYDGAIQYWLAGYKDAQAQIPTAHENAVWCLAWHPLGYVLCSTSNDHTTKFWSRSRPGDTSQDSHSTAHLEPGANHTQAPATSGAGALARTSDTIPGLAIPGLAGPGRL